MNWKSFLEYKKEKVSYAFYIFLSFFLVAALIKIISFILPISLYMQVLMEEMVSQVYFWPAEAVADFGFIAVPLGLVLNTLYFYILGSFYYLWKNKQ